VLADALAKGVLAKGRLDFLWVQIEPPRHREQVLRRETVAAREQQRVGLPEPSAGARKLRQLGGQVGAWVKLGIREVAPHQPQSGIAIEE
jgi:hypothetical protein